MRRIVLLGLAFLISCLRFPSPVVAEIGVTDTEIVIGSHLDLSGPIAGWGANVKMGLEMRAREINEAGGIHGRKIRLIIEDNGYDPKKAIMATSKMINRDKVFCFIGNMGSPTAGATKPLISRKKIPQMFPLTGASLFFTPYDRYSFGGFIPYYDQARALVKYFVDNNNLKRFGILYQDDEMGAIMTQGIRDQLAIHNLDLVAAESYKRGATEFSSQITKLRKAGVDIVVLATVIRETVGALKEANKLGWNVVMSGMSPAYTMMVVDLCKNAGFSADGLYTTGQSPYPYVDSTIPGVADWVRRHHQWFGKEPDLSTTAGYSALDFFQQVAERVGRDLTRENLIVAIETMGTVKDRNFGGPDTTFTPTNHQGVFDAILFQVRNGKFVKVADIGYK